MKAEEILNAVWEPIGQDCMTFEQDLQLAITLNPSLNLLIVAMKKYARIQIEKDRAEIMSKVDGMIDTINLRNAFETTPINLD